MVKVVVKRKAPVPQNQGTAPSAEVPSPPQDEAERKLRAVEREVKDEVVLFVADDFLAPLKTPDDYRELLGQQNTPQKLKDEYAQELPRAERRASWEQYRSHYFEEVNKMCQRYGFIDPLSPHNKDKEPKSMEVQKQLLALKALGAYEDVFIATPGISFSDKLKKAIGLLKALVEMGPISILKYRKYLDESGEEKQSSYGIHDYQIKMAFFDALYLAMKFGIITNDADIENAHQKFLEMIIQDMAETHGKENEYRFIYLRRLQGEPIVHSTLFQDHEEAERNDIVIFGREQGMVEAAFYQLKGHDFGKGAIRVPEKTKEIYERIVETKDKNQQRKIAESWQQDIDQQILSLQVKEKPLDK